MKHTIHGSIAVYSTNYLCDVETMNWFCRQI